MRRSVVRAIVATAFLPVVLSSQVDSELASDLADRRARFMAALGDDSVVVLRSAPVRNYSGDVNYEYRQDSNLYYLTGIREPDTTLVLMPGGTTIREVLFVRTVDPVLARWEGSALAPAEATAISGIRTVLPAAQFEPFLAAILSRRPFRLDPAWTSSTEAAAEFKQVFDALGSNRLRLAFAFERRTDLAGELSDTERLVDDLRRRFFGFSVINVSNLLGEMRQVKTAYERRLLQRSAAVSSDAHLAAMRATHPGVYEYEVEAALEAVFLGRGASGWSYPSIVASGPNATTLHYEQSARRTEAGDLLLIDAAANFQYMTVDITRTFPVTGTFTAEQRDVYNVVLAAQQAGIDAARPGALIQDIETAVTESLKSGLVRLGLITDPGGSEYRTWYMHGAVHFIGIDVHDAGNREKPLEPGVAFVIEPGVYVWDGGIDQFDSPERTSRVRPAYEKYLNIGVRIEDSFLLTSEGLLNLSAAVPKTIPAIEAHMAAGNR